MPSPALSKLLLLLPWPGKDSQERKRTRWSKADGHPATYRGKGFKQRIRVCGERPIGADSFR